MNSKTTDSLFVFDKMKVKASFCVAALALTLMQTGVAAPLLDPRLKQDKSVVASVGDNCDNCAMQDLESVQRLERIFGHPCQQHAPRTWWHWMDRNISKEGITKDLEAMKEVGLGGATIFNVSFGIPIGDIKFMSNEWKDSMAYASKEANRLGLKLSFHNSAGWSSSGAPWVKPQDSMKKIVFAKTSVNGGGKFIGKVKHGTAYRDFYRDIALLAVPVVSTNKVISSAKVIDLTGQMAKDGSIEWIVPNGDWELIRFGYTSNGRCNKWGGEDGTGLECDKLSVAAVEKFWDKMVQPLICTNATGLAGGGFSSVVIDSWEVGSQNWTDGLEKIFLEKRGYDIIKFLPHFAGYIIDSKSINARFHHDFKSLCSELFVACYAGTFKRKANENNMDFAVEGYGWHNFFNNYDYSATADIPMGEFFAYPANKYPTMGVTKIPVSCAHAYGKKIIEAEAFTTWPTWDAWKRDPYSIKAVNDRVLCVGINRMVYHRFTHQPFQDKYLPGMTMGPFGIHFDRTQTWWKEAQEWVKYQARCQALLQEGLYFADALFYQGEGVNCDVEAKMPRGYSFDWCNKEILLSAKVRDGKILLPSGMTYSFLRLPEKEAYSLEALAAIERLATAGATIIGAEALPRTPSLTDYPNCDKLAQEMIAKIWPKLVRPISVEEFLLAEKSIRDFDPGEEVDKHINFIHRRELGTHFYFIANAADDKKDFVASFRIKGKIPELWDPMTGNRMRAPLYSVGDGVTKVKISLEGRGSIFVVFARSGAQQYAVEESALTNDCVNCEWAIEAKEFSKYQMGMSFESGVLPNPPKAWKQKTSSDLSGPWDVYFPAGWGAPEKVKFDKLICWTERAEKDIRYFSGSAIYSKTFTLGQKVDGERYVLDLGTVKNFATVTLNGKTYPAMFMPPFKLDVTEAVKSGENRLSIRVTNLWPNRLIGDEQLPLDRDWSGKSPKPSDPIFVGFNLKEIPAWVKAGEPSPTGRYTFTTWWHYKKDAKLLPSGLLGPVYVDLEVSQ
jgi:hypothetical protein